MNLAYADPPYPGRAHLYVDHPDYAGEVDHIALIRRMTSDYDGWALSTSAAALRYILPIIRPEVRVLAWVKNTVNVSWEPVIVVSARQPHGVRDWIHVEVDSYQWRAEPDSYVLGQKPEAFCRWVFEWLGAHPDDTLDDLFPGSGNVGRAWAAWRAQPGLFLTESSRSRRRAAGKALEEHPRLLPSAGCGNVPDQEGDVVVE